MKPLRSRIAPVLAAVVALVPTRIAWASDGTAALRSSAQREGAQTDYAAERRRVSRRTRAARRAQARHKARENLRALAWEVHALVRDRRFQDVYEPATEAAQAHAQRGDHEAASRVWVFAADAAEHTHEFPEAADAYGQAAAEAALARGDAQAHAWAYAAAARADALVRFRAYDRAWIAARSAAQRWASLGDHTRAERFWHLARLCGRQIGAAHGAREADDAARREGELFE